jgi:hypothetical protein
LGCGVGGGRFRCACPRAPPPPRPPPHTHTQPLISDAACLLCSFRPWEMREGQYIAERGPNGEISFPRPPSEQVALPLRCEPLLAAAANQLVGSCSWSPFRPVPAPLLLQLLLSCANGRGASLKAACCLLAWPPPLLICHVASRCARYAGPACSSCWTRARSRCAACC